LKQELRIRIGDASALPTGWYIGQQNRPWILVERSTKHALLSVDCVRNFHEGFALNRGSATGLRGFPDRESTSATPLLDAIDDMDKRYNAAYPNP